MNKSLGISRPGYEVLTGKQSIKCTGCFWQYSSNHTRLVFELALWWGFPSRDSRKSHSSQKEKAEAASLRPSCEDVIKNHVLVGILNSDHPDSLTKWDLWDYSPFIRMACKSFCHGLIGWWWWWWWCWKNRIGLLEGDRGWESSEEEVPVNIRT